jgi:hypothetical protein
MSIDVAIPGDRNVIQKEAEKILKYNDLTIEMSCMWNVTTSTSNNWSDWNHFRIIKKIREHHTETMKLRNYKKLPYWALHNTLKSADVKVRYNQSRS